jgi:hypothetical protein
MIITYILMLDMLGFTGVVKTVHELEMHVSYVLHRYDEMTNLDWVLLSYYPITDLLAPEEFTGRMTKFEWEDRVWLALDAAGCGQLPILDVMRLMDPVDLRTVWTRAAVTGNVDVLEWARQVLGCRWHEEIDICSMIAANPNPDQFKQQLEVLVWARSNGCSCDECVHDTHVVNLVDNSAAKLGISRLEFEYIKFHPYVCKGDFERMFKKKRVMRKLRSFIRCASAFVVMYDEVKYRPGNTGYFGAKESFNSLRV